MWWIGAAMAQDVVLDDFTGPDLTWYAGFGVTFEVPPDPWDAEALACDVVVLYGVCEAQSAEFVVTHDTIRFRSTSEPVGGSYDFALGLTGGLPPVLSNGRPLPGTWDLAELAIPDGCGQSGSVFFSATTPPFAMYPEVVYFDDLELAGAVCSEFVDLDGDGGCYQGNDLDGDGFCIAPGEPATFGVVVDPDEGSIETGDTGGSPTTTEPTGDTGVVPTDTGTLSDSGVGPTVVDTQQPPSDTGGATDTIPQTDDDPLHSGEAPVHEEEDSGGFVIKTEECGCGTGVRSQLGAIAILLLLARRRRTTAAR
jgi:hypothetical protein